jgi:hypothetical protein
VSDAPRVVSHLSSITPEQARDARASAWKFVFDCYAKRNAGSGKENAAGVSSSNGDDTKGRSVDDFRAAEPKYTR